MQLGKRGWAKESRSWNGVTVKGLRAQGRYQLHVIPV